MRAKTLVPILLIVVVAAAAAIGGAYFLQQKKAPAAPAPAQVAETPSASGQPQVGFNAALQNTVTLQGDAETASRAAEVGGAVHFLDLIETRTQSWLKVDLRDEREFSVGAEARVKVDKFVYDPEAGAGEMTMSVVKGVFRYASGSGKPETVSFQTPTASIGIRGTTIEGVVGSGAADFLKANGQGVDAAANPDNLAVVILRSGAISLRTASQNAKLEKANYAVAINGETLGNPFLVKPKGDQWLWSRLPPVEGMDSPPPPAQPRLPSIVAAQPPPAPVAVAVPPPAPAPVQAAPPPPQPVTPAPPPRVATLPPPEPVAPPAPKTPVRPSPPILAGPSGAGFDPFNPNAPQPKAPVAARPRPTINIGIPIGGGNGVTRQPAAPRTPAANSPPAGATAPSPNTAPPKPPLTNVPATTAPPRIPLTNVPANTAPQGTVVYPQSQQPQPLR